jgi:hypothetical protein
LVETRVDEMQKILKIALTRLDLRAATRNRRLTAR